MKRTLFLLLVSVLLLAACAPADPDVPNVAESTPDTSGALDPTATTAPTATADESADESADTPAATPTDLPADPTAPPAAADDVADSDMPSDEDGDGGFVPATSFEDAAVVRDVDWVKGAEDPVVVIIEYGDFQ